MNIKEFLNSNTWKKVVTLFGYIVIICIILIVIWKIGTNQIEEAVNEQHKKVSKAIIETVENQAKMDLFRPDIVFIGIDSLQKKQIVDSLKKQIVTVLFNKYLKNDKSLQSDVIFQPFFVFPDSPDNKGNYSLTKVQLDELKNHITFLTSQVDKAVKETKDEVGKDIDRLNTMVSIWIGIIGFIGVFIPIVINIKIADDLKEIKINANDAKSKADEAETKASNANIEVINAQMLITNINNEVEKVKNIPDEMVNLKSSFQGFEIEVKKAKEDSGVAIENSKKANEKANKLEKIVSALNVVGQIRDLDAFSLHYYKKNSMELLIYNLKSIYRNLQDTTELFSENMIFEIFRQLAFKLHLLATYDFINPANLSLLNQFSQDITNLIAKPLTEECYKQALDLLNKLNSNLESK